MVWFRACVSLLFSCLLVIVGVASIWKGSTLSANETGTLSIHINRVISYAMKYEDYTPDIYVEVEAGGVTYQTHSSNRSHELVVNREFVFHGLDYFSFVVLRIKDRRRFNQDLTRSVLLISLPDIENNKTRMYNMDWTNWYVVRLHWVKDAVAEEVSHNDPIPAPVFGHRSWQLRHGEDSPDPESARRLQANNDHSETSPQGVVVSRPGPETARSPYPGS